MKYSFSLFLCLFLCSLFQPIRAQTTITYQTSPEDFPNPERGFYRATGTNVSNFGPLNPTDTENYRNAQQPFDANYSVRSTLVFRYFVLDDFKDAPISAAILQLIDDDFNTIRAAGMKIIPRFTYINTTSSSGCDDDICAPFGDAPKDIVLTHISQLAPILQEHADVIATVQMGFIGIWGENYYSDHFGFAGQAPAFRLTDENWEGRNEVLAALLNAVPSNRTVQVRYPQIKQRLVYGVDAPTTSAPLTPAEAYSGSDKSRIGFHNDCFMASFSDFGTYVDYGNSSTPSNDDTTNLRAYYTLDSRYVPVGGETCFDGYSPENDCAGTNPLAYADTDLERMHYSFINADYNQEVNNDWETGGCMEDIKRRLGYRFELTSGTFAASGAPGSTVDFNLGIRNVGYAAPFNPRRVDIVLRNNTTGEVHYAYVNDDPRNWAPASTTNLSHSLCLPVDLPAGTYSWLISLPDPAPSLADDVNYNIRIGSRLGGAEIWEPATGFHDLGATLTVTSGTQNPVCNGEVTFTSDGATLPVTWLAFTANWLDKQASLSWTTEDETGNEGFGVERSTDGITFRSVGWVAASPSESSSTYFFTDSEAVHHQTYYYRLRQEDVAGSFTYSPIRRLDAQNGATPVVSMFPNPTPGLLQIDNGATIDEFTVINLAGQLMSSGTQPTNQIDITGIAPGIYFIQFRVEGQFHHQRIVVR